MRDEGPPPGEARSARILIADDHPLYREALRLVLRDAPDLEVVGEAADGWEALELCRRLRPELVLMDVRMPEMDGLAATRAIKREFPRTIVLIITSFEDTGYLLDAIGAGAAGYVLKDASRQQIIGAVRGVLDGECPLNQELAMRLLRGLLGEAAKEEKEPARPASRARNTLPESLSPREVEVLRLLVGGRTNHEIARSLLIKHQHRQEAHAPRDRQARGFRPHPGGRSGRGARLATRPRGRITPPPRVLVAPLLSFAFFVRSR